MVEMVYLKALMCIWGVFWNILIVIAILNDPVLRRSSTFLLLVVHFIACAIDVGSRLVFDVPSEILNRPLFRLSENYDDFPTKLFHFTTYSAWFVQLYSLIAIAFSHIIAVYASVYYSSFSVKKTLCLIVFILIISMGSVSYLWSPEFPIKFYKEFWGWAEDREKPLVKTFFYFNYVVQVVVFACLIAADIMIIYKISKLGSKFLIKQERSTTVSVAGQIKSNTTAPRSRSKLSTELKVSINFIIVTLFLLTQTLIYNICTSYDTPLCLFLLFIAPIFRGSKCLAYLVSGGALRNALYNLICCKKSF